MKVFFILALFVLSISADTVWPNSQQYHQGFADGLGLDASETQDGLNCINAITQSIENLYSVYQNGEDNIYHDPLSVLNSVAGWITQYQQTTVPICKQYIGELEIFIYTHANTTGYGSNVFHENWSKYAPEIIQLWAHVTDQLNEGNSYQAGQTEAQIFEILMGNYQPQTLPAPQYNFSRYVPFNVQTFIADFYEGNLKAWGVTDQEQIDDVIECANLFYNLSQTWTQLSEQANDESDFHGKVPYIKEGFSDLVDTLVGCSGGAWEVYQKVNHKLYEQFTSDPVGTILKLIYNTAENLPQIVQDSEQMGVYEIQGEYTLAGELDANLTKLILTGLYSDSSDSDS